MRRIRLFLAFGVFLAAVGYADKKTGQAPNQNKLNDVSAVVQLPNQSKTVDPCSVASAAQLQPIIVSALKSAFPLVKSSPGKKITLSDPELVSITCANPLTVQIRAKIKLRDTRGLDQGQASGQVRFSAKIYGKVSYAGVPNGTVSKDNFKSASACMSDLDLKEVNINNIPNWFDNTVLRDMLRSRLGGSNFCVDITTYVALYLATGKTL